MAIALSENGTALRTASWVLPRGDLLIDGSRALAVDYDVAASVHDDVAPQVLAHPFHQTGLYATSGELLCKHKR